MLIKLNKTGYAAAMALFKNSRHQMKLNALAEGGIEAAVWTDGPEPAVTAVQYCNKKYWADGHGERVRDTYGIDVEAEGE